MFWRTPHPTLPLRAGHRALGLARAALLLEPPLEQPHELADPRASHPHRTPLRARRARRRGGAVLARPQHCITPLVRRRPAAASSQAPPLTLGGRRRITHPAGAPQARGVPANGVPRARDAATTSPARGRGSRIK